MMRWNGGSWADAVLLWLYFGVGVQAAAFANIAYRISKKHQIVCTALFTCMAAYLQNDLAGFQIIAVSSASLGPALGFAFLAISFLVGTRKNYNLSWVFAGCAAICHIHEGIYCCVVIFIVAVTDSIMKKRVLVRENIGILVAAAAMLLVILPNMITDKMDISNDLFVFIYSLFRHPHHLVPTSWGFDTIVKSGWINILLFALSLEVSFCLKQKDMRRYLIEMALLTAAWFGALACACLFTERIAVAFISTLFLSKMFKYVVIVAMIFLLKAFVETRICELYFSGYLLLFFVFMTSVLNLRLIAMLYLFSAAMIMVETGGNILTSRFSPKMILPIDAAFFCFLLSVRMSFSNKQQIIAVILIYMAAVIIWFAGLRCRKAVGAISLAACCCLIVFSFYGRIICFSEGTVKLTGGEKMLVETMGDEAYDLAAAFNKKTKKDEGYIGDPDDATLSGWFQVASERNCYVIYKAIPSSKSTIDDWYERYLRTQGIYEKEISEVEQIMIDGNADYLLVKEAYFDKFDQAENMSVFLESSRNALRIYRLNRER